MANNDPRISGARPDGSVRPPLVLLVTDDPTAVEPHTAALTNGGLQVLYAENGEQAIEFLHQHSSIECVIIDVSVPQVDRLDVLRSSKILRPQTPVVIVASPGNPKFSSAAIRDGADDMLIKPIDLAELATRVMALIERARVVQAARAHTVLAIGAHPDDVEIGVAGTLLRHVANGDHVIHLMMTDGEGGGDKQERILEAERAAATLGVTLVREGLPDGFLSDARETVAAVARVIAQYNPSMVYVHSPHDGHQDHRTTFHAAVSAGRGVQALCCYQSPSATVDFRPTRFVDIGDYLDAKVELIKIYRSQTATRLYLAEDMIRATARYWGRHAAHRLVEPLEVAWQLTP